MTQLIVIDYYAHAVIMLSCIGTLAKERKKRDRLISKRPPPEEVAFQNAPYKGGKCHIPFSTLATPSAVHVFVPSFPDASHIV
ncbi:hypothetical protein MMW85_004810 [Salmonella enterica]|nr:hypothetical protein [Salmonella enterica]EHQ0406335.1 hypothetical protein [Salmonella enterica subsp. enterica serovar Alachua]EIN4325707.1 hypothetical protein [Salmonella enterica]EIN4472414.1 hypothetical protein [Salmonella enterica]EIY4252228.1 hypothetical protein [Salmonella enterica]